MKTIDAATPESLRERAGRLTPDSARHWGRMTPHQAVWHLKRLVRHVNHHLSQFGV